MHRRGICRSNAIITGFLLVGFLFRIGEAKNPGPVAQGLTIGCFNPTGIMHKAATLSSLPTQGNAIWGVCESHLSRQGIHKFRQELEFRKSRYRFLPGAPAPLRSQSATSLGGKQVGTGFLSDIPGRQLQPSWPKEAWDEARFNLHSFFVQGHWIHAACFYGYAYRAESTEVRQITDTLLSHITQRVVFALRGKRVIVGDFNQTDGSLTQTEIWRSLGWKEIQILDNQITGRPISKTCKNKTTKDFVWISPELQPFFKGVETAEVYMDHTVLCAHFRPFGAPTKMPVWRKPSEIDWTKINTPIPSYDFTLEVENCDLHIQKISEEFEHRVDKVLQKQNQNLHHRQKGRSQTRDTIQILEHGSPITPSRHGEKVPLFHGHSLQHKQWFQQVRRLQSLVRLCSKSGPYSIGQEIHMKREWRAILQSSGFPGGFPKWWRQTSFRTVGSPVSLPWDIPEVSVLIAIATSFDCAFQHMEQLLIRQLTQKAQEHRIADPNKIFSDVRKPRISPITMLDDSIRVAAEIASKEHGTITLQKPVSFDASRPAFLDNGQVLTFTQTDSTHLHTDNLENVPDLFVIRQDHFEADLQNLFHRFGEEWKSRWDRHLDVPCDHWEPICDVFKTLVPKGDPLPYEPITLQQWNSTLKGKKRRAATGPDGWARQDLLQLPEDLTLSLIQMLHDIELGKPWPQSVVTGIVYSLEKVENAAKINQYRPITIFSLIYRTWSSIRARQCLLHLAQYASGRCCGNIPHKSTTMIWMGIQSLIEQSEEDGEKVGGAMVDIVKCFNHLPRMPIMEVCIHLGIDSKIIRAWSSALCQMERRFHIRGATGPGIKSTTGCAEGCALSVVGMLAINLLVDSWMKWQSPSVHLWSYVDNLEITASQAEHTIQGLLNLRQIMYILDLQLDDDKTFLWSNDMADRKIIREADLPVKFWARDLGGHVQYGKMATNSVITKRMASFKPRWRDFARSKATYKQKLKAVRMVAYPNVLHGIASVHVGEDHYEEVRTGVMTGLCEESAGASPYIHLSLLEFPTADPGFYAVHKTVMDVRVHLTFEACQRVLDQAARPNLRQRFIVGPCHVLLHRLQQIGWSWHSDGFHDEFMQPIDLWQAPIQLLLHCLVRAWQTRIAHKMSARKSFGGLEKCSPYLTRQRWPTSPIEAGVLRTCLNGTFYTADHLKYVNKSETALCPFCSAPDSKKHRHWECKKLEHARKCNPQHLQEILSMSDATTNHGWIPQPEKLAEYHELLHNIKDTTGHFLFSDDDPKNHCEIFTDGSCRTPANAITRLATWGVVVSSQTSASPADFWPVSSGVVPGLIQTITRAELMAIKSAFKFGVRITGTFRLWTDNQFVFNIVHRMIQAPYVFIWPTQKPNHDLILDILQLVRISLNRCVGIIKVCSHADGTLENDAIVRWSFRGNQAADECAASAIYTYPKLLSVWTQLVEEVAHLEEIRKTLHRVLIDVGIAAMNMIRDLKKGTKQSDVGGDITIAMQPMQNWILPDMDFSIYPKHHISCWHELVQWNLSLHDESNPTRWLSWAQIFADFRLSTKLKGPWYDRKTKRWMSVGCPNDEFLRRYRWFKDFLNSVMALHKRQLPTRMCRPDSFVIGFWCLCLPVQISGERFEAIESWFVSKHPFFRSTPDLRLLKEAP